MRRLPLLIPLVVASAAALNACYDRGVSNPTVVTVPAPTYLNSVSLNGAVYLSWDDTPYASSPNAFSHYQVYSTSYDLDHNLCGSSWSVEGTTVSPEFLVGALTNGVPLCLAVSAISVDDYESDRSPLRNDTPRPDARNVVLFSTDTLSGQQSGFRFWLDANGNAQVDVGELGLVGNSATGANDFILTRNASRLWLTPQRSGVTMQVYGTTPIADLTSIDLAPNGGYSGSAISAAPMWGYVFQIVEGQFYKYGAIRVTAVGPNYVIFDWSYQTDPGNPELVPGKR
ncbi:MAG: hypothetical protein ABSG61_11720 [Gemmatimonadales bacterium]|jgi:hypothetical protein